MYAARWMWFVLARVLVTRERRRAFRTVLLFLFFSTSLGNFFSEGWLGYWYNFIAFFLAKMHFFSPLPPYSRQNRTRNKAPTRW